MPSYRVVSGSSKSDGRYIPWWLALTIFVILGVAVIYFYMRSKINKQRENLCWRFVETGQIPRPE